jgi:hypothetical protein
MTSPELDRLVQIGALKTEPPRQAEIEGLIRSGEARLADAKRLDLSPESRFDLAYNAAHALALAALRWHGYRSDRRYLVFQTLPHTLGIAEVTSRLLTKAHERRNLAEYEGLIEVDERLLADLLTATADLLRAVRKLVPLKVEDRR